MRVRNGGAAAFSLKHLVLSLLKQNTALLDALLQPIVIGVRLLPHLHKHRQRREAKLLKRLVGSSFNVLLQVTD